MGATPRTEGRICGEISKQLQTTTVYLIGWVYTLTRGLWFYPEGLIIEWLRLEGAHYLVILPSLAQYGKQGRLEAFIVHSTGLIKGIIWRDRIQEN